MTGDDLTRGVDSDDLTIGLRAVGALRRLTEEVEATYVATARTRGWSWEQIGEALGVSPQSVHARYGGQGWASSGVPAPAPGGITTRRSAGARSVTAHGRPLRTIAGGGP